MKEKIVQYNDDNILLITADSKEMVAGIRIDKHPTITEVVVCFTKSNKNGRRERMRDSAKDIIKQVFGKRPLPKCKFIDATVEVAGHKYDTMMILSGTMEDIAKLGNDVIFPELKKMLV